MTRCLLALLLLAPATAQTDRCHHPVDLNTATLEQLQKLPGIGPARAAMILRLRAHNGPFKSVDELRALPRLSDKQFEQLRKRVTVRSPSGASDAVNTNPP